MLDTFAEVSSDPAVDSSDSGLQCLLVIALLHGVSADEAALRHEHGTGPFDDRKILLAARQLGLTGKCTMVKPERLDRAALPAIAVARDGSYFVLAKLEGSGGAIRRALIQRAGRPPESLDLAELLLHWSGQLLVFVSRATYAGEMARFDFTWFLPSAIKYRALLGEILLVSLALQFIALATPLFFQVVMDKVLVNRAVQTLDVIAVGLVLAMVFEALLNTTRAYLFSHTTSKIDVELGARLLRHLLRLPLSYFHARRVGDSIARVRELENIRSFLTGSALTLVFDLLFSGVFLAVMFWYSTRLTLVVIGSLPVYAVLSLVFTPLLRAKLNDKFNRGAESQSFLVEAISGIDTVKAMAIEPRWNEQWEGHLAAYISAGLNANTIGLVAGGAVRFVGKLVSLAVMWAGAWEVMKGHLSVGELIAFNMLSGQVAAPVLRLAQLWNDFQQVGISMQRLGDILNTRTEIVERRSQLPRLHGAIEFDHVHFRYTPEAAPALRGVSFRIAPGEVIGIVGRSGSGKSTATRLLQRLYVPERGRVLVDRHDLATVDTSSLRRQLGVVPQEGTLFNRSVRENIALTFPGASFEAVVNAARLAGAHEFICDLPDGYETFVGEHGTRLSGGQRQRISIARALLHDPRILILDEATSALDYESERAIQDGMAGICRGRTVVIVAHRLSAVRNADRIIVLDVGQVAEVGTHQELIRQRGGIYAQLHDLQLQAAHGVGGAS